jgi:hypothetical protein
MTPEVAYEYGYTDGSFDCFTRHEYDCSYFEIPADVHAEFQRGYSEGWQAAKAAKRGEDMV